MSGAGGGAVRAVIVPTQVLKALIGQSQRRCKSFADMLSKLEAGMEQLRFEAERFAQSARPDQETAAEALQYFQSIGAAFVRTREHLEAQAHYELRLQDTLQRWLAVASFRDPGASPRTGGGMRRVFPARSPERAPGSQSPAQAGGPPFRAPAPSAPALRSPEQAARPAPFFSAYLPRPTLRAAPPAQPEAAPHEGEEVPHEEASLAPPHEEPAHAAWEYGAESSNHQNGQNGQAAQSIAAVDGESEEDQSEPA